MKCALLHGLFVVTAVSTTIVLFVFSADNGSQVYAQLERLIRDVNERNANMDAAVLSLRLGLKRDYDDLTYVEKRLLRWGVEHQRAAMQSDETWATALGVDLSELSVLINRKVTLSHDFKAHHAIVRNALAGFLRNVRNAYAGSTKGAASVEGDARLEALGTRFYMSGNANDQHAFEEAIQRLEDERTMEDRQQRESDATELALRHARKLIELRNSLDETISRLVAVPIRASTTEIMENAATQYAANRIAISRYRTALCFSILMLIGYCAYQFVAALKRAHSIGRANEQLEHKVTERTKEISQANEQLTAAVREIRRLAIAAQVKNAELESHLDAIGKSHAVIEFNMDGTVITANEMFLQTFEYSLEEIQGQHHRTFCEPWFTNSTEYQTFWNKLGSGDYDVAEHKRLGKNGKEVWILATYNPVFDVNGQATKVIKYALDVTDRKQTQEKFIEASRQAGMAEVATGVLHNVGNVLNSVNVSVNLLLDKVRNSCVDKLAKASQLISHEQDNLGAFLTIDERGKHFPRLLNELTNHLTDERDTQLDELRSLVENVDHIKEIVSMQQSFAKSGGAMASVNLVDLVEDALKLNDSALIRNGIGVVWEFYDALRIVTEKHTVLQILVNLISNAMHAVIACERDDKTITVRGHADEEGVSIQVIDNGVGIPRENLTKIFCHGFTTKEDGHGFGLHSSALAAQELGGSLSVQSSGAGLGSTFTLRIPLEKEARCEV